MKDQSAQKVVPLAEQSKQSLTRRRFLRVAGAGVAAGALGALFSDRILQIVGVSTEDLRAFGSEGRQWVMLIDLAKCDGCGRCTLGCTKEHFVPKGQEWIKVYKIQDEFGGEYFLPRPCMNCENAPCLNVCPVGATFRSNEGVVLVDHRTCIGCRYCMAACPYDARYFNWGEPEHTPEELAHPYSPLEPWPHRRGTVTKCDFCVHDARKGILPACVRACTEEMGDGAIYYGDLREDAVSNGMETIPLSETLRKKGGFRFKEELGTRPRVFYLPPRDVIPAREG
jgi:molybdopterin-containing oxidoreductase family iron-sulfur binding subunit